MKTTLLALLALSSFSLHAVTCDIFDTNKTLLATHITTPEEAIQNNCVTLPQDFTPSIINRVKLKQEKEMTSAKEVCAKIPFYQLKKKKECKEKLKALQKNQDFHLEDISSSAYGGCFYSLNNYVGFSLVRAHRYGTQVAETFYIKPGDVITTPVILDISKQVLEYRGEVTDHFQPMNPPVEKSDIIVSCRYE